MAARIDCHHEERLLDARLQHLVKPFEFVLQASTRDAAFHDYADPGRRVGVSMDVLRENRERVADVANGVGPPDCRHDAAAVLARSQGLQAVGKIAIRQ